jgi:hypothetical protein
VASAPRHTSTTTIKTPTKGGGTRTVTTSTTRQGGNVTKSKTITVSPKKKAAAPKKAGSSKKAGKPAKLARPPLGGTWICGPNEDRPLCAPVAIANSLLAATGIRAGSAELERLYRAAGGWRDSGVPLAAALAAAKTTGLAGCRLEAFATADDDDDAVLLLTLDGVPDLHAAAVTGGEVILWGEAFPVSDLCARAEGAWALTWR